MHEKRLSIGFLCLAAPMYFVMRFLLILLLAHNIGTGWLRATLLSLLIETFGLILCMYIASIVEAKIYDYRAKKGKKA
jgi:uncharacterized membrane protein (DUF485 family)